VNNTAISQSMTTARDESDRKRTPCSPQRHKEEETLSSLYTSAHPLRLCGEIGVSVGQLSSLGFCYKAVLILIAVFVSVSASAQTPSIDLTEEPLLKSLKPRPTPAMPSTERTGVGPEKLSLTLNDAVRMALENNNEIEIMRGDVRFAGTSLRSVEGVYDPVLRLNPQFSTSILPNASVIGGSNRNPGAVTETTWRGGASIAKLFSFGGGQYEVFSSSGRTTTNSILTQLSPQYSSEIGVSFTQPLLRNRGIDRYRREIRVQRKRLDQSDAEFRRKAIEIIAAVQRAYWELVFSRRDQENREANLALAHEQFRVIEERVGEGRSAPLDRAEVETETSTREAELIRAVRDVSIAENNLKQLLLRDPNANEWTAQVLPLDAPRSDSFAINTDEALKAARENRPELERLRLEQEVNAVDIQYYRNQTRPRVDLQSTVSTVGLSGSFVPPSSIFQTRPLPGDYFGGGGRAWNNAFNFDTRSIAVGLTIELPIRNRTAQANLSGAKVRKDQLQASTRSIEQSIEVEVRNAVQTLDTARRTVTTARSARASAQLQVAGERELFQNGRSTTFLVFQRENALANARNLEVRAETDYHKALSDLQRAMGVTLRASNVVVDPVK
jgi:outer membrane protein